TEVEGGVRTALRSGSVGSDPALPGGHRPGTPARLRLELLSGGVLGGRTGVGGKPRIAEALPGAEGGLVRPVIAIAGVLGVVAPAFVLTDAGPHPAQGGRGRGGRRTVGGGAGAGRLPVEDTLVPLGDRRLVYGVGVVGGGGRRPVAPVGQALLLEVV